MTSRTSATRRVATAWPALRARSQKFDFPAPNARDKLEVLRATTNIISAQWTNNLYANESSVARHGNGS